MTIFYLDLECDDLAGTNLLQIACMSDKNKIFNGFCTTTISLSQRCTQLTGFHTKEGKLFQHSKELKTHEKRHILESFNKWLSANTIGLISLIAHNGHGYDYRVLFKHFLSCSPNRYFDQVKCSNIFYKQLLGYYFVFFIEDLKKCKS